MLNTAFAFGLEEFSSLETQIQFFASMNAVSSAFNDGYQKWNVNGLGEAYGFWFKLKSNGQPFIVKTLVQVEGLDRTASIEWLIDAKSVEIALQVIAGLKLDPRVIFWKKGE